MPKWSRRACIALLMPTLFTPAAAPAAAAPWQPLAASDGRRLEVDPKSVIRNGDKVVVATRTIFDKGVPDALSGTAYHVIEATGRYDCGKRTVANLRRIYRKDQDDTIREESSRAPAETPVRGGSFDDKILSAACSPAGFTQPAKAAGDPSRREIFKADLAAAEHPKNSSPAPAGSPAKHARTASMPATRPGHAEAHPHWTYEGPGGPAEWAALAPDFRLCANGQRQSPIDIRDGIGVDLEAIEFDYRPSTFKLTDNGHTLQAEVRDNSIRLLGVTYRLLQFHFHRPSEERIDGRSFAMVAHLVHRSDEGRLAVIAVLLEPGRENPLVQTLWNHLPLEQGRTSAPPQPEIDLARLLPEQRGYFTYMGSLTTPPCSEGVLWLVLKTPVEISPEQAALFARLYENNARPIQPGNGRLIKGSR